MKLFSVLSLVLALVSLSACGEQKAGDQSSTEAAFADGAAPMPGQASGFSGTVLETMDTSGYTYALIKTADEEVWVAGPQTPIKAGDEVTATSGMFMGGYHSKSLDRDFEGLYFVSAISVDGATAPAEAMLPADHPPMEDVAIPAADLNLDLPELAGAKTIAELFAEKDGLAGKSVLLQGKVIKFNEAIMGKNWVHLQDGSGDAGAGTNDLTITTSDVVQIGDVVRVTGTVVLGKDFGAGYSYDLMVEDAMVKAE